MLTDALEESRRSCGAAKERSALRATEREMEQAMSTQLIREPAERIRELMLVNLFAVFNERDPERRWEAITRNYTEDVIWTDPEGTTHGREALRERAQELLDGMPDFVFTACQGHERQLSRGSRATLRPGLQVLGQDAFEAFRGVLDDQDRPASGLGGHQSEHELYHLSR
jgi:hypothetical protein